MKKIYAIAFLLCSFFLQAQNRYLDAMFGVKVTPNLVYGNNITVLTANGTPAPEDLKFDLYEPEGDTRTDRPLVLIAHTGSFLPPLYNGQITGSSSDSTVTAAAKYLAARGFVVAAYTYRLGWLPTAPDVNVRTSTLLQAAYRGIQDTRSCIRYFKKSVAEGGNAFGIDLNKIAVYGVGVGGYLSFGAGSLNDFNEVVLDKFINSVDLKPYIDSTIFGNIYGTSQAVLCLPNHPGYSSNFQFAFNLGGALGDSSWLDGEAVEPAYSGMHCVNDFFAPYYEGAVIVPTTREFVVNVIGTRKAIELANKLGSNAVLNTIPDGKDPLEAQIEVQKATNILIPLTGQRIQMGDDHFYGLNLPPFQGSPWDWWDLPTLRNVVAFVNQTRGTNFNADTLHFSGLQTNPDMSQAKGRRYLDTAFALFLPRACAAMGLGCTYVDNKEVSAEQVGLSISPNPAVSSVYFSVKNPEVIQSIYVYDMQSRLVKAHTAINNSGFNMPRNQLGAGVYLTRIHLQCKTISKQIVFEN
ncbi:MAG: T9SS type A sorting domain-containing protein [Saprospiraceae bacterium]|nr:T9SS type A sorting domain-containing protein [Saprospiraceae bacterium]